MRLQTVTQAVGERRQVRREALTLSAGALVRTVHCVFGMDLVLNEDAAAAADGGVEKVSSAGRRRIARGGPVAASKSGQKSSGDRRSWAWSSDATSVAILQRSFQLFDKDGDGAISASELKSVLSNLGEDVQDDMVGAMIDLGDTKCIGEVSYDDFLSLMMDKPLAPKASDQNKPDPTAKVRALFNEIDSDGAPAQATPLHLPRQRN